MNQSTKQSLISFTSRKKQKQKTKTKKTTTPVISHVLIRLILLFLELSTTNPGFTLPKADPGPARRAPPPPPFKKKGLFFFYFLFLLTKKKN